ncbi:polyhydroxyalkanoic acid system family protein [Chiayiivirga flava]|uniref:Putative polyhydroxyalkanoate system protein n=1 Tax=Chiayiivirga flava TaxID=659595 RepID=A0A7W8D644_9GAMM|nr:polyhydroxyalkanoic acid system family protein [Chiayiivirga flava]MBB5208631.1 putative polyhydroxyalkanoate system protein [Chiayiivirga flava]
MPSIDIVQRHNKSMKDAKASVDRVAEKIGERFQVACGWKGNTLEFTRSGVNGEIRLAKDEVRVVVNLGFLLSALKGPIESEIHRVLEREFA